MTDLWYRFEIDRATLSHSITTGTMSVSGGNRCARRLTRSAPLGLLAAAVMVVVGAPARPPNGPVAGAGIRSAPHALHAPIDAARRCLGAYNSSTEARQAARSAHKMSPVQGCLAHGRGEWKYRPREDMPYRLDPERYVAVHNRSAFFWGRCDRRFYHNGVRDFMSMRARWFIWYPKGDGCDALGEPPKPFVFDTLRRQFCKAHAGSRLLFVGDSTQGQLFTSFVHALGVLSSEWGSCHPGWETPDVEHVHEIDLTVQLCAPGPSGVTARFIRNEAAVFNLTEAELAERRSRVAVFCRFTPEVAAEADVIVLNRGFHYAPPETFTAEFDATLRGLMRLPPLPPRAGGVAPTGRRQRRVIVRSTHAPIPRCNPHSRISPVSLAHLVKNGRREYHWDSLAGVNAIAECLAHAHGATFIDVYHQSSFRPDAAVKRDECVHSCLPGPVDEWSRLIALLLVHDRA